MTVKEVALKLVSGVPWFWRQVSQVPVLRRWFNRLFINTIVGSTRARPHPLSLWGPGSGPDCAEYTSWTGLVDRTYTGRHLPPANEADVASLPAIDTLKELFERGAEMRPCPKSSALFAFFAQWFTDSFLRTDPNDVTKNTSNHEIDLCQIYGLTAADTALLRTADGELKSQCLNGEEYPPFLFEEDGLYVKPEFRGLSYVNDAGTDFRTPIDPPFNTLDRKKKLFAGGLERGNSTVFYSALNTVFLREHNRLCRELRKKNSDLPGWDGNRLFETVRNINIATLLKIIVEDYINHLSTAQLKFELQLGFAEKQVWYRTNRISAEFNLLYRWHQLVPTELTILGQPVSHDKFRYNNDFLVKQGIGGVFGAAANLRAGSITLKNTPPFLVNADLAALKKSRAWRIRPYNAYRECFGLDPVSSFEQLTDCPQIAKKLSKHYSGNVNNVDLLVGLLAERRQKDAVLGDLMTLMVGVDAFSQALTNPLLSRNVYGTECFSNIGLESINNTSSFDDIVSRNTVMAPRASFSFNSPRDVPGSYGLPIIGRIAGLVDFFLVSGWERFFLRRQRKYGSSVFKTNLFQPTIAVLDHRAISALFASDDLIQDYGFSWAVPPRPLVGDVTPSIFESGTAHDGPKALYLRLLEARARSLLPTFHATMSEFVEHWLTLKKFNFSDELENLTVCFLFEWVLGKRPDPKDVRLVYNGIFTQFGAAIAKFIPWSNYSRSLKAYDRLLAFVKSSPRFGEIEKLARETALQHAGVPSGEDELTKQLLFLLGMNSFLGTQSLLKSVVGELSKRPRLCDELRKEISELGPKVAERLVFDPAALPTLDKVIRETLRLHPPVFFIFGRATRDRTLESRSGTFLIKQGELVMGVIPIAQTDPKIYAQPDDFDVKRFDHPVASQHLIWPRGLHDELATQQDRTCPGKDVAVLIAKLFSVALLNEVSWRLETEPQWDRKYFSLNVAAPKGLMEIASISRRSSAAIS